MTYYVLSMKINAADSLLLLHRTQLSLTVAHWHSACWA